MVGIVREKYLNQAKTSDKAQLQNFLSELCVFLSDQMHAGLNKVTASNQNTVDLEIFISKSHEKLKYPLILSTQINIYSKA